MTIDINMKLNAILNSHRNSMLTEKEIKIIYQEITALIEVK